MSATLPITAVILTKNSAATLERVLQSLDFCEHILIADDGSTDTTLEIARKHHINRIKLSADLSFASKRNQANDYVQTPWALHIDADEWVSSSLKTALIHFFSTKQSEQFDGMYIQRVDFFWKKKSTHGEIANQWILRFARTKSGTFIRPVHEIWEVQGRVGKLSGQLYHSPHESIESFFAKIIRYTKLEADHRFSQGERNQMKVFFQLCTYPLGKFMYNFIFKLGFLDGLPGFVMAYMMSLHSLYVRLFLLERIKTTTK